VRGAALADLHLGFRAFAAVEGGRNVRERDVEDAWERAVDAVIAEGVDLVTIAGDIFHHPRVSDYAKRAFLRGVRKMLDAGIIVIVLQGNHDAGRTAEVLTPIALAEGMGSLLHIVTTPKRIRFRVRGEVVSVACFPFVARGDDADYRLDPDQHADVNVLLMHAAVKGSADGDGLPYFYGGDQALDVGREADRWDVIACGDYHEFTRLHPSRLAFYSGSIERTSSDIWKEDAPKGWVLYDTATGTMDLREIETRPMLSFNYSEFQSVTDAEGLNVVLAELSCNPYRTGEAIVRLKVPDFPAAEREHIDWSLVRKLKETCLHFYLDVRYAASAAASLGDRRDREVFTLADEAARFFADDPEDVRDLVIGYLDLDAEIEDLDAAEEEVDCV